MSATSSTSISTDEETTNILAMDNEYNQGESYADLVETVLFMSFRVDLFDEVLLGGAQDLRTMHVGMRDKATLHGDMRLIGRHMKFSWR